METYYFNLVLGIFALFISGFMIGRHIYPTKNRKCQQCHKVKSGHHVSNVNKSNAQAHGRDLHKPLKGLNTMTDDKQKQLCGSVTCSAELGLLKNYLNERIEDANNNLKTAMKANNEMEFALFAIEKKTLREVLALVEKIKR